MFDRKIYDRIYGSLPGLEEGCFDVEPDIPILPDLRLRPEHPLINNPNTLRVEVLSAAEVAKQGGKAQFPRVHISSQAHEQFVLLGYDGLSSPSGELTHLDHAILDGGTVSGARAQSRRITFDFVGKGISYSDASALFPLGQKELIRVTRGHITREIEGYRDGPIEVSAVSALSTPIISVSFLCPNPYFRNSVEMVSRLDSTDGGLEYPVSYGSSTLGYSVSYGALSNEGSSQVYNGGNYPTPFILTTLVNTQGTLGIRINGEELAAITGVGTGQLVVFDTANKMLTIAGNKSLSSLRGTFPMLPIGLSEIELTEIAGDSTLRFSEIFEGI